jgi:hypothetical protein
MTAAQTHIAPSTPMTADGPPLHGLGHSAGVTVPANGLLVFARD